MKFTKGEIVDFLQRELSAAKDRHAANMKFARDSDSAQREFVNAGLLDAVNPTGRGFCQLSKYRVQLLSAAIKAISL